MKELSTIQKREKLNTVYVEDVAGAGNGRHNYIISDLEKNPILTINFQHGARKEKGSIKGILDVDLLEIVRSRLQYFQAGEYATRENAIALTHIEEVLLWMNKRAEDRIERNVLGKMKK